MRALPKILLSACTLCALGHAERAARADAKPVPGPGTGQNAQPVPPQPSPSQVPPPPTPSDSPTQRPDPTLPDPTTPGAPTNPPGIPAPTDVPVNPAPPAPTPPADDTAGTAVEPTAVIPDEPIVGEPSYSYAWYEPTLQSGIGVSAILGGGVTGFTDRTMRSTTADVGGLWDLRVTLGSHLPIAVDLAYLGSATNINGLPSGNKGRLIGTTVEGALRYNVLPHFAWTPYVFAGVGWQRYDVTETNVSLSDSGMNDHDNLVEFPIGTGLAYRMSGFVFDLKGTFRAATEQNLVLKSPTTTSPTSSDFATMHTWEASAAVGYEF